MLFVMIFCANISFLGINENYYPAIALQVPARRHADRVQEYIQEVIVLDEGEVRVIRMNG